MCIFFQHNIEHKKCVKCGMEFGIPKMINPPPPPPERFRNFSEENTETSGVQCKNDLEFQIFKFISREYADLKPVKNKNVDHQIYKNLNAENMRQR